ncbi:MAG: HAD family phosphatase [Peptococcaceae bacterium]|jgi:HAD superfamily hydrolase (TIGR01509 family)|nr:HAD family phosphatase [Peptococcaceae bacterium]
MIKAILFDMDGVLIDSEPGYLRADAKFFAELGLPFGEKEIAAMTGANNLVIASLITGWHPHLAPRQAEIAVLYENGLYKSLCDGVTELMPGAMAWVTRAKAAGLKVCIGSSSSNRMVYHVADAFGLTPLMDAIITGEMVKRGKPNPDIYLRACEEIGVAPGDCVIIEDSPNGLKSGRAAGTYCAAFHGTNRHGLDLSDCDMSFDAYTDEAWSRLMAL